MMRSRKPGSLRPRWPLLVLFSSLIRAVVAALDPACAPGGNFDLSIWDLEMPIGRTNSPDVIRSAQLRGCGGFQDSRYFYTDKGDGALVMKVPGDPSTTGCVKWAESSHCRTEFREVGAATPWDPRGVYNEMSATVTVTAAGGQTCIGQVFHTSGKPVCELYYWDSGRIAMGVAQTLAGGNQVLFEVGNIPRGERFSYEIRYDNNVLKVRLNGGGFITLPTYSLNAPKSFFKIGNYLQGKTESTVRFYDIKVSHTTPPPTGTWPPFGVVESPRIGLGPFNILTAVGTTITSSAPGPSSPPKPPSDCDMAPSIVDDWIVNFRLYTDSSCCQTVQTTRAGTLNNCQNSLEPMASFRQAVGQRMFGREIRVFMYEETNCKGEPRAFHLTNQDICWDKTEDFPKWRSFMISASATAPGEGVPGLPCEIQQPAIKDDWAVTFSLYGEADGCCGVPVETTTVGRLGACRKSLLPFRAFTQAVGQEMFSRDIRIFGFDDENCLGVASQVTHLTNAKVCHSKGSSGAPYSSFMIATQGGSTPGEGLPGCSLARPQKDSDSTIRLNLYEDSCCDRPAQTINVGTVNGDCKKATRPFQHVTMNVGQNMFNRNLSFLLFSDDSCSSTTGVSYMGLTNSETCHQPGNTYGSFRLVQNGGLPTAPTCDARPAITDQNAVRLQLTRAGDCCTSFQSTQVGRTDVCHTATQTFGSFQQAVGQGLFGKGNKIRVWTGTNCAGTSYLFDLTNTNLCWKGVTWRSFMLVGPAPVTPAPTAVPPGPPVTCDPRSTNSGADSLAISFYKDPGCCEKFLTAYHMDLEGLRDGGSTSCYQARNTPIYSVQQSVGQNLFGRDLRIQAFEDANCGGGTSYILELTNRDLCWTHASRTWRSYRIIDVTPPPPPPPSPPPPSKLQIRLGLFQGQAGTGHVSSDVVWVEGDNVCRATKGLYSGECKTDFCLRGICGFGVQGCSIGDNVRWITLNGAWYSGCYYAYRVHPTCAGGNALWFGTFTEFFKCDG